MAWGISNKSPANTPPSQFPCEEFLFVRCSPLVGSYGTVYRPRTLSLYIDTQPFFYVLVSIVPGIDPDNPPISPKYPDACPGVSLIWRHDPVKERSYPINDIPPLKHDVKYQRELTYSREEHMYRYLSIFLYEFEMTPEVNAVCDQRRI